MDARSRNLQPHETSFWGTRQVYIVTHPLGCIPNFMSLSVYCQLKYGQWRLWFVPMAAGPYVIRVRLIQCLFVCITVPRCLLRIMLETHGLVTLSESWQIWFSCITIADMEYCHARFYDCTNCCHVSVWWVRHATCNSVALTYTVNALRPSDAYMRQ